MEMFTPELELSIDAAEELQADIQELGELQLALIGGGCGETILAKC